METCNHAPMLGARSPNHGVRPPGGRRGHAASRPWTGFERRIAKIAERELVAFEIDELLTDATAEVIERHAITPDEFEGMVWFLDDVLSWEDDRTFEDLLDLDWDEVEETRRDLAGEVEITTLTDREIPGGWGTGVAWEDLAGLTITNRPYGYTRGAS